MESFQIETIMRTRSQTAAALQVLHRMQYLQRMRQSSMQLLLMMQRPQTLASVYAIYDRLLQPDAVLSERLCVVAVNKLEQFRLAGKMPDDQSLRYQARLHAKWAQTPKNIRELFEKRDISM